MIISVEELRKYVTTDTEDAVLEARLQALELSIRKYTNNNFQKIAFRSFCDISDGVFTASGSIILKVGETVQVTASGLNEGLYTIKTVSDNTFTVNEEVYPEKNVLVTKVEYPADVKMGLIDIIKWQIRNEEANGTDTSKKPVRSETLSRWSVTYAQDATESDIHEAFGCPRKYLAFLKGYKKARF